MEDSIEVKLIMANQKNLHFVNKEKKQKLRIINAGNYRYLRHLINYVVENGDYSRRKYSSPLRRGSYENDVFTITMSPEQIIALLQKPMKPSTNYPKLLNFLGVT